MSLSYKFVSSLIGTLKLVASNDGLVTIVWENDNPRRICLSSLGFVKPWQTMIDHWQHFRLAIREHRPRNSMRIEYGIGSCSGLWRDGHARCDL